MSHTDHTNIFGRARWPDAPQRVLETPFYDEWKNNFPDQETEEDQPIIGHSIIHGVVCIWISNLAAASIFRVLIFCSLALGSCTNYSIYFKEFSSCLYSVPVHLNLRNIQLTNNS
jgi:hypothetical protein